MKKKELKVSGWSKHSFSRSFENNTFESLILEMVRVDIGRLLVVIICIIIIFSQKPFWIVAITEY